MTIISKSLFGSIPAVARSRLKKRFKLNISKSFCKKPNILLLLLNWYKITFLDIIYTRKSIGYKTLFININLKCYIAFNN